MTIKEAEKELGIPRASIRFYEKKNLIHPDRGENAYREYSEEDIAKLKTIIILRKIGISVGDIEELLNNAVPLSELIDKNILQLQEQIEELSGALKLSKIIKNSKEELSNFNEAFYWEEMHKEEKDGNKFLDIANDILQYEKKVILQEFDIADFEGKPRYGIGESVLRALGCCVAVGGLWFLLSGGNVDDAIEGFFFPFVCIIITSIFGLPIYLLGKKHPKVAGIIKKIGTGIAVVITVLLLILVVWDFFQ